MNPPTEQDHLLAKLYLGGLSTYEVAAAANVSQGKVGRALRRTNTPRRNYRQAEAIKAKGRA